ncbi:MAG: DUF3301 domain-containing protein [Thiotrichaceae bacterium]
MNSILIVLLILAALIYFWLDSMKSREKAIAAAHRACREIDVQLLDQTVSLQSIKPTRNRQGRLSFQRIYQFEFSIEGVERRQGRAIMLGQWLQQVQLDDDRGVVIETKDDK